MAETPNPSPFSQARVTDEQCVDAYQAWRDTVTKKRPKGRISTAARALNLSRSTYRGRLSMFYRRNLGDTVPIFVAPGMQIAGQSATVNAEGEITSQSIKTKPDLGSAFEMPPDYVLERATLQTDGEGNLTQQWMKLRKDAGDIQGVVEAIKEACAAMAPPKRPRLKVDRKSFDRDLLNLHPLADLHLGMFAWGRETHGPDWDLPTAVSRYEDVMAQVMARSPKAKRGLILGGGDLVHSDNMDNKTRKSGNVLDVDSRYQKVVRAACDLMVYQVELALQRYETVDLRILPGNHDEHVATAVIHYCDAWFRNEERVNVDTDPSDFWYHQHGLTMLAANHGHKTKLSALPAVMANRQAKMWGATEFRYGHGFHIHHKTQHIFEDGGAICETHQAPVPSDAYHAGGPYISGRSMCSISYSKKLGEMGRSIQPLRG